MSGTSTREPLAVKYGYIEKREFDYLSDLSGDADAFARAARDACIDNIPLYSVLFLGYEPAPHIRSVRQEFDKYDRVLLQFPRDHSKSVLTSISEPSHDIAYSTLPGSKYTDPRILLIQESTDQARQTVRAIKSHFESGGPDNLIKLAFGDVPSRATMWGNDLIYTGTEQGKDPSLRAIGIGASITGAHPKKIICDDMVSFDNSRTPHLRRLRRDWWYNTINPMLGPTTTVRIPHTPYFEDDLHNVLKKSGSYRLLRRPALNRWPKQEDYKEVIDEEGVRVRVDITDAGKNLVALWPCPLGTGNCPNSKSHYDEYGPHRPVEWLIERYLENPIKFSTQFMLEDDISKEARIKPADLRFYSFNQSLIGTITDYNDNPVVAFPSRDTISISCHGWDHAIGKTKMHDRTALARAYRTKENDVFFINKAGRWDFPHVVKMMEVNYKTDGIKRPVCIATEGIGFQQAYTEMLQKEAKEILPVQTIKIMKDKDTALVESGLLGLITQGKVYVDVEDEDTIQELLNFTPDQRFHDDIVDAMRIAYGVIREKIKRPIRVLGT